MEDSANLYTVDFENALEFLLECAEDFKKKAPIWPHCFDDFVETAKKAHTALKKDLYGED